MTPWTFLLILSHAWFCHVDFSHILLIQGLNSVPINAHWKLIFVVWVTESRSIWPSLWKKNYLLKPSHTPIWLAYSNEKKQVQSCTFSDGQSQDTGRKLSCSQQTTQNHSLGSIRGDLNISFSPTSMPKAMTSFTRSSCSKPHPTWS